MKSVISLLIYFLICTIYNTDIQDKPSDILKSVVEKYSKHKSLSYTLFTNKKYLYGTDTSNNNYEILFYKVNNDKYARGYIWMTILDKPFEVFYDTEMRYRLNKEKKKLSFFDDIEKMVKNHNIHGLNPSCSFFSASYNFFLNPNLIEPYIDNDTMSLEIINNGVEYSELEVKLKNGLYPSFYIRFIINKKDSTLDEVITYHKKNGNYQYMRWVMTNQKFNKFDESDLIRRRDSLIELYGAEKFKCRNPRNDTLISVGNIVPNIKAYYYRTKEDFNFYNKDGKLYLLDFWYISCPPCLSSIPCIVAK